jgi:hypothetical protein
MNRTQLLQIPFWLLISLLLGACGQPAAPPAEALSAPPQAEQTATAVLPTAPATPSPQVVAASPTALATAQTDPALAASATPLPAAPQATPLPLATAAPAASCTTPAGLPDYPGATCLGQASDRDGGATETQTAYGTTGAADDVRRFYEGAFAANGWTVQQMQADVVDGEWDYTLTQGQRQLKLEIDTQNGVGTRISIEDAVPSTPITCAQIAGLPIFSNAACVDQDTDIDDGLTKARHTYITSAAANDVRLFYEGAFASDGWTLAEADHNVADGEWSYTIIKGASALQVEVTAEQGPVVVGTRLTIEEK